MVLRDLYPPRPLKGPNLALLGYLYRLDSYEVLSYRYKEDRVPPSKYRGAKAL